MYLERTTVSRTFTTRDVIEAMERNGYRKANGAFVQFKENSQEVYAACAIGQALLNLGVKPENVEEAAAYLPGALTSSVYDLNDQQKWELKRIVREVKTWDVYTKPRAFGIPDELFGADV